MTRTSRLLAVLIAVIGLFSVVAPVAQAAARTGGPKVVVIVGPVGNLTDRYRAYGATAVREARRWTSNVVTVVSPNATWPAVRSALQGASVVVYLGHGNGFPSPHRSEPNPRTQNGLGLNPVAGVDDSTHQYFGESFIARDVRLASGAVVLLSHLCYASGNPEPGGPNPSIAVASQRVDNYAAGWFAAGAGTVVADAFAPLDEYLGRLLRGRESIDRIWRTASTHHDNVISLVSARTPSARLRLDPTEPDVGFFRSIAWIDSGPNRAVPASESQGALAIAPSPGSLAALGVEAGSPVMAPARDADGLIAAGHGRLTLPLEVPTGVTLPTGLRLGVQWQPLDSVEPASLPDGPPPIAFVAPEQPAAVVASTESVISDGGRLAVDIDLPQDPGRYRLTTTIHDADDVAFDAATQELVATLVVTISPPLSVAYGVADSLATTAGTVVDVPIRIANPGSLAWAAAPTTFDPTAGTGDFHPGPRLVARWIPLDTEATVSPVSIAGPRLAPGEQTVVLLSLSAPTAPGEYLLLIDLVSPLHGSLAASGAAPARISATVEPPLRRGMASDRR